MERDHYTGTSHDGTGGTSQPDSVSSLITLHASNIHTPRAAGHKPLSGHLSPPQPSPPPRQQNLFLWVSDNKHLVNAGVCRSHRSNHNTAPTQSDNRPTDDLLDTMRSHFRTPDQDTTTQNCSHPVGPRNTRSRLKTHSAPASSSQPVAVAYNRLYKVRTTKGTEFATQQTNVVSFFISRPSPMICIINAEQMHSEHLPL